MGYYSNRVCFSIEGDEPQLKSLCDSLPKSIKIPEWFDDYSSQVLDGEISDECVEQINMLQGLRNLYRIAGKSYPRFIYPHIDSEVVNTYEYNALLATNYLLTKRAEKSPDMNVIYQTAYYLMPPVNEYDENAFVYLHQTLLSMVVDFRELNQSISNKITDAVVAHDFRKFAGEVPPCKIMHTSDDKLFELVDVGGGKTDILIPVFSGTDAALFECKLVPTSQAVVNNLRGYAETTVAPLPQYAECSNVASTHFANDFLQFMLPDYMFIGKASISAYLNERADDAPDLNNPLDTFYKFIKVKEKENGDNDA